MYVHTVINLMHHFIADGHFKIKHSCTWVIVPV